MGERKKHELKKPNLHIGTPERKGGRKWGRK